VVVFKAPVTSPPAVAATVIAPAPLVMLTPPWPVMFPATGAAPFEPIRSSPF
jgi:hypothetical protein